MNQTVVRALEKRALIKLYAIKSKVGSRLSKIVAESLVRDALVEMFMGEMERASKTIADKINEK